jgi:hypothetical protein
LNKKSWALRKRLGALEENLFNDLVIAAQEYIAPIQIDANVIAHWIASFL